MRKSFFSILAERLENENDISDITWALCCSDGRFQKIFLDYCFDEPINFDGDIERESSKGDSRPDFSFADDEGKEYILEVKKYDKDAHKKYKKEFKDCKRAFIANYEFSDKDNIYHSVKTWHGFIKHLEGKKLNTQLINGYIRYLKSVTDFYEGDNMNLKNLHSLVDFVSTVKEIIENDDKKAKNDFNPKEGWIGFDTKQKNIHFFFGLWLSKKTTKVWIQFCDDTAKGIKTKLMERKTGGKFYDSPEWDLDKNGKETGVNIFLKKSQLKKLFDENILFCDQKDILKNYYDEVMQLLE